MSKPSNPESEASNGENAVDASSSSVADNELKSVREEIEEIKKEDLSGQQLRLARKLAQKHDLEASSDLDAVRMLRNIGINPFGESATTSESASIPMGTMQSGTTPNANLPVKRPGSEVGAKAPIDEGGRARAVLKIQRDLMRRRRRRMFQLATRLLFFIGIPTLFSTIYFYSYATPMYAAKSEFVVQSASNPTAPATDGGFFGGGGLFGDKDPVGVQGYLTSIEAMLRLDEEHGFKAIFQNPEIDPIQKLKENATNEEAYKRYKKSIVIGFDQTEGVIRMEVITPDPKVSVSFTNQDNEKLNFTLQSFHLI